MLFKAIDDISNDRFPLSLSEAVYLAGLRAQALFGKYHDDTSISDYV